MIGYYITDEVTPPQIVELKEKGYFLYDMRTADDCKGFVIEPIYSVRCNHEGVMITNQKLVLNEVQFSDGVKRQWLNDDDFFAMDVQELNYDELRDIFSRNKNTNFHFHIKGKIIDTYACYRNYDISLAKIDLRKTMKRLKEKDPTVRAYRFGISKNRKDFYKVYDSIKQKSIWSVL